jgi:signal transduction histidine kinase
MVIMGNALRLFVFCLALAAVGLTAALTQLRVRHHAKSRQQHTAQAADPAQARIDDLQAYHEDQQHSIALILSASFLSLLVVALTPGPRRTSREDRDHSRNDRQQVEHLARATVVREEALRTERAERQRADENLHLQQLFLNQALGEKINLGRNLHDGVIQSLYATGLTLESSRQKRSIDPAGADALFDRGLHLLNENIREVRAYINSLSQSQSIPKHGFSLALTALIDGIKGGRETEFSVHIDEQAEARLDASQMPDVLQIIREASSNALRHGAATQVIIRLHEADDRLGLLIQDNGTGFEPTAVSTDGHGLANFKARADSLDATLRVDSRPGNGTRVSLTFPVLSSA